MTRSSTRNSISSGAGSRSKAALSSSTAALVSRRRGRSSTATGRGRATATTSSANSAPSPAAPSPEQGKRIPSPSTGRGGKGRGGRGGTARSPRAKREEKSKKASSDATDQKSKEDELAPEKKDTNADSEKLANKGDVATSTVASAAAADAEDVGQTNGGNDTDSEENCATDHVVPDEDNCDSTHGSDEQKEHKKTSLLSSNPETQQSTSSMTAPPSKSRYPTRRCTAAPTQVLIPTASTTTATTTIQAPLVNEDTTDALAAVSADGNRFTVRVVFDEYPSFYSSSDRSTSGIDDNGSAEENELDLQTTSQHPAPSKSKLSDLDDSNVKRQSRSVTTLSSPVLNVANPPKLAGRALSTRKGSRGGRGSRSSTRGMAGANDPTTIEVNIAIVPVSDVSLSSILPSTVISGEGTTLAVADGSDITGFDLEATPATQTVVQILGDDGNLFNCHICRDVGDVVCCDGCPQVYHPKCVPQGPSRRSLDADDDLWFCPDCFGTKTVKSIRGEKPHDFKAAVFAKNNATTPTPNKNEDKTRSNIEKNDDADDSRKIPSNAHEVASTRPRRSRGAQRCSECQQTGGGAMGRCEDCGVNMHFPSCRNDLITSDVKSNDLSANSREEKLRYDGRPLCSNCRAEVVIDIEKSEKKDCLKSTVESDKMHISSLSTPPQWRNSGAGDRGGVRPTGEQHSCEKIGRALRAKGAEERILTFSKDDEAESVFDSLNGEADKDGGNKRRSRGSPLPSNSATKGKKRSIQTSIENGKKRPRKIYDALQRETTANEDEESASVKDISLKEINASHHTSNKSPSGNKRVLAHESPTRPFLMNERPVKATPAFFFFLADNRIKLERHLAKKHRLFKKSVKGFDRNIMVAKEGAIWWQTVKPMERKRFMDIAMQEFEDRIILWKEEENITTMLEAKNEIKRLHALESGQGVEDSEYVDANKENTDGCTAAVLDATTEDLTVTSVLPEDDKYWQYRHHRLVSSSQIECKAHKSGSMSTQTSNNKVLLELLQDTRFHPLPMVHANRSQSEFDAPEYSKMTIPYFAVQGPIATSVGDECLGCTRGWNHYCPILQRQFPAVEHRAKLQPPVSSLLATRVGLGLKQTQGNEFVDLNSFVNPFGSSELEKSYTPTLSMYLNQPSARVDDIVNFIEEAIAVKILLPPHLQSEAHNANPAPANTSKASSKGELPTKGMKKLDCSSFEAACTNAESDGNCEGKEQSSEENHGLYECGKCLSVILSNKGCINCRRAQLVLEISKRQPVMATTISTRLRQDEDTEYEDSNSYGAGFLKTQTVMLGRAPLEQCNFDRQKSGDRAIADALITKPWKPSVVLPPPTKAVLFAKPPIAVSESAETSDDQSDTDTSTLDFDETGSQKQFVTREGREGAQEEMRKEATAIGNKGPRTKAGSRSVSPVPLHATRQRSSRICALSVKNSDSDESTNRQKKAEKHQEEANDLHKHCLSIASCGVLLGMIRRDPLRLFAEPVPDSVEGYHKIITKPMDFNTMRKKVLDQQYATLGAFVTDARLLCVNAMTFNPPGSVYWNTAKEIQESLEIMQKRASDWMAAIKGAHNSYFARWGRALQQPSSQFGLRRERTEMTTSRDSVENTVVDGPDKDAFKDLRYSWPGAAELLDDGEWLRSQVAADFIRTKENETAYYGCLAVRRAVAAAEASLAVTPDSRGIFKTCVRRNYLDDEALRNHIDEHVAKVNGPVQLKDDPSWREEDVLRLLRRVQKRRVEARTSSESGCARCDGTRNDEEAKLAMTAEAIRSRRMSEVKPRIVDSRLSQSTGFASAKARERIANEAASGSNSTVDAMNVTARDKSVGVRGSRIHGWGLFADHPFKKGEVVAEYVGEYITNLVADSRERFYQERRIQDYQFRVSTDLVIDATRKGGHGRYINHHCNPNCTARIIDGEPPNQRLKRVLIVSQRDIEAREEITYDYQFSLELDLNARIPCNCGSKLCRGFMNWDLPETGSQARRYERRRKEEGSRATKNRIRKASSTPPRTSK